MLIGEWDISNARAKQWNVSVGSHALSSDSMWDSGSVVPVMFRNKIGFKTLSVTLLVYGDDRQGILNNRSLVLSHMIEPVQLTLDGFANYFYGILTKATPEETAMNRWHKLTLEFNCYECGSEVVLMSSGTDTMSVSCTGNIETPAVIEITPQIDISALTVYGICKDRNTKEDLPVVISNLKKGKKIVLDGEIGIFTQDGATGDIDIWEMPSLDPGDNTITTDNIWVDIMVRFRPRFM